MYKILKKLQVFLVFFLVFSVFSLNYFNSKAFAAATLTVSHTVDNNKVTVDVSDNTNLNDAVTVLIIYKDTNSIAYLNQSTLQNGKYTLQILLPKGEYIGYVSSSNSDKVTISDLVITTEEKIVGFKPLEPISVQKGTPLVLPVTVIAIFDDGANREVDVQWTEVPNTDICGQYTVTGKVNGTEETVSLLINVVDTAPTTDTTPPTAPTNLTADSVSKSQINLSWSAATDNVGVAGYKIFRDGTEVGTASKTSYIDTGLRSLTSYSYYIKAFDAAGNLSDSSNIATTKTEGTHHNNGGTTATPTPAATSTPKSTPLPSAIPVPSTKPEPSVTPAPTATAKPDKFRDVGKEYDWARDAIEALSVKGIIKGTGDNIFEPSENITRADFILLLMRALDLKAEVTENFSDTNSDDYYYNALGIAKKLGIATGTGGNSFNPGDEISRQDMMVLCTRALQISGRLSTTPDAAVLEKFRDKDNLAEYASNAVSLMVQSGIIVGNDETLNPLSNATRAETAVIIYRMINLKNQ